MWTFAAVARRLGRSRARVTQMVQEGKLAVVTVDGKRYVSGASFYNYLVANQLLQLNLFEKQGGAE